VIWKKNLISTSDKQTVKQSVCQTSTLHATTPRWSSESHGLMWWYLSNVLNASPLNSEHTVDNLVLDNSAAKKQYSWERQYIFDFYNLCVFFYTHKLSVSKVNPGLNECFYVKLFTCGCLLKQQHIDFPFLLLFQTGHILFHQGAAFTHLNICSAAPQIQYDVIIKLRKHGCASHQPSLLKSI